jgi:hypothetical protein
MLEIDEEGDSTYIEWGDPDSFFGGRALFKAEKPKSECLQVVKCHGIKQRKIRETCYRNMQFQMAYPLQRYL